jgi:ParB family chromosome partitioning protein
MKLSIAQIKSNGNVRLNDNLDVTPLVESLRVTKQFEPIQVYRQNGHYVLIDGHRRLAAAVQLGWEEIDANVQENPDDMVTAQYVINEHRKGLTQLEKAQAYQQMKNGGISQAEIARNVGVSEAEVSLCLALLRADPKLQDAVNTGRLAPSAIEPMLSLSQEEQGRLADAAIQAKTVRKISALVKAEKQHSGLSEKKVAPKVADQDPMEDLVCSTLADATENIQAVLSLGVRTDASVVCVAELRNILNVWLEEA